MYVAKQQVRGAAWNLMLMDGHSQSCIVFKIPLNLWYLY